MIETELVNLVSNVGFPIAMCFYLMLRFEKILKKNTDSVEELTKYLKEKRN